MRHYIGIDGGGSKTELLLCNEEGKILRHMITGGSNPVYNGIKNSIDNVEGLINRSLDNIDINDIGYISICVPGLKKYSESINVLKRFQEKYEILGDELNAFYGSLASEYGIVILSGTGSFAMGINRKGQTCTAGGWGSIIGDEGSGYYIGVKALGAVTKEYDSMGSKTILSELIKDKIKIRDISELRKVIYCDNYGVKEIASLSELVKYGAQQGDEVCIDIIKDCAHHFILMIDAIVKKLNIDSECYDLCLTGGISNFGELIINPLKDMLKSKYPYITLKKPQFPPVVGSIMLCFRHDMIEFSSEKIQVLNNSLKEVGIDVI